MGVVFGNGTEWVKVLKKAGFIEFLGRRRVVSCGGLVGGGCIMGCDTGITLWLRGDTRCDRLLHLVCAGGGDMGRWA